MENEKNKKAWEATREIKYWHGRSMLLQNCLDKLIKPIYFWQKPQLNVNDIATLCRAIMDSKSEMWDQVIREYPELKGKNYAVDSNSIYLT